MVLRFSRLDSSQKELAQYLPKLRHRRKTADDGGGPREFLIHLPGGFIYNHGHILYMFTIAHCLK
jgi:hypothetical protein